MEGKKQEATQTVHLPAPKIVAEDPDFKKTKKIITKQLVSIEMILHVTEYQADVYRNSKTGEKVHAAFPAGVVDDVNYDGSIKSLLFLLNTDCAVSIDKSQRFLSDLTGGKLKISRGMINKLCREIFFQNRNRTEKNLCRPAVLPGSAYRLYKCPRKRRKRLCICLRIFR